MSDVTARRDLWMETQAKLLAEGHEPDEIDMRNVVHRALVSWARSCMGTARWRSNVEEHDAGWYATQAMLTELHEDAWRFVSDLLSCRTERCSKGLGHEGECWDGQSGRWLTGGAA